MAKLYHRTGMEQSKGGQDNRTFAVSPLDDFSKQRINQRKMRLFMCKFLFTAGIVCLVLYFARMEHHHESMQDNLVHRKQHHLPVNQNIAPTGVTNPIEQSLRQTARTKYENCNISFVPPLPRLQESEWRKPLWVPSFPASGSASPSKKGDLTKQLIDTITGLKQGTKNYHMSIKGGKLRRCKGMSETAACTQGHPYVPVGPESQTANFQPWVVFAIRNFATAFPASHTDKNIAYHGAKGQAPEEQWRKVRDQYLESSMESWRDMIRWWKTAEYYQIALYLPFEWLLSPTRGPGVVHELAQVYERAGFQVAPSDDISCIWYQMASREWQRQDALTQYVPGYTIEQRDFLVRQLEEQINETRHDIPLTSLLEEYKEDILRNTRLDRRARAE